MSFWHITAKDLYLLVRDRRTFAMLLLLPLAFITIIGMTTGKLMGWRNSNQVLKIAAILPAEADYAAIGSPEFLTPPDAPASEAPAALSDDDRTAQRNMARHIVADIVNGVQQAPGVEVRTVPDWREQIGLPPAEGGDKSVAGQMISNEEINAAIVFEPDFYKKIYHLGFSDLAARDRGKAVPDAKLGRIGLDVLTKDPNSSTKGAISSIVAYQARDVIEPVLVSRLRTWTVQERAQQGLRELLASVERMRAEPPPKLQPPKPRAAGGSNDAYQELVPSYTVMFVFFLVNLMARSFLNEREMGTLRRLRIAPISRWSILAGKTTPFLIVSLLQTVALFVSGRLLFSMSWGADPWLLLPVIFATSCAATGLGLLIATLVKSDSQVSAYATTAVILLAGISGCFMPRKWLPEIMQQISLATPHAWALMAYDQILSNAVPNVVEVWKCVGMLLAFAAAFFLLGGWRFRATG